MKFSELQLHPALLAAVEKLGFTECTPIQSSVMPALFEGRDVAGLAQTGTGKTAAFLLPLMDRILRSQPASVEMSEEEKALSQKRAYPDWKRGNFILVLVPTRELADQVEDNVQKLRGDSSLRAVSIYGGVAYEKQKQGLRNGVEFIVATPGRLLDLYKEHLVDLKQVRAVIFDEADRMFDMGFKDDMKYILSRIPRERQFLVFSATLNLDVLNVAYQYGANPLEFDVSRDQAKAENVEDQIYHLGSGDKPAQLLSILRKFKPKQAIIFSNFKLNVPRITQFLNDNQIPAVGISSLLTQAQRNRVMEQFKGENDSNILVATDVAARGLDIKGVDMVINYELPDDPENYVHRIGRTGRAGAKGLAFSMVSDRDVDALSRIEDYLKHKVNTSWLDDADIVKEFKPFPSEYEAMRGGGGGSRPRPAGGGGRGGRSGPREGGRDHDKRSFDKPRSSQSGQGPRRGGDKRHENRRPDRNNEKRAEGGAPSSAGRPEHSPRGDNRNNNRPNDRRNGRPDHNRQDRSRSPQAGRQFQGQKRPHTNKSAPAVVVQKSVGEKIKGFLKRLFS